MEGKNYWPNNDNMDPREGKLRPKSFWRRYFWQLIAIISVVLMLIFAISTFSLLANRSNKTIIAASQITPTQPQQGSTPATPTTDAVTATPTVLDTPTATPIAALPCIVDIGNWTSGSKNWKILNQTLLNDGSSGYLGSGSGPTIVAPCQPGTISNYAVETKIQVISSGYNPCFGITVRGTSTQDGWQGYKAGIGDCGTISDARLSGPDYFYDQQKKDAPFDPGKTLHTYRIEVRDNTVKFQIDSSTILTLTDNRYLNGAEVGLWDQNVQLQVVSFKVVAL